MTFSYDASEATERDIIRGRLLDTTDPGYLPNETYDAIMARHDDWRLAGAEIAARIARMIAARPVSVSDPDGSIRWSEKRADLIAAAGAEFLAEYDADPDVDSDVITVSSAFLTTPYWLGDSAEVSA